MNTPIWGVGQRNPRHRPFAECREIGQSSRIAERSAAGKNLGVRQFSECHAGGRRIRGQPQLPLNSCIPSSVKQHCQAVPQRELVRKICSFITLYFYVLSLEYPQAPSSSI